MEVTEALRVLGLGPEASWAEVRTTYRSRVRQSHPDTAGTRAAGGAQLTRLNEAYSTIAHITARGTRPLEPRPAEPRTLESSTVLHVTGGEPFLALLDASHELGDVIYVSRSEGLIQVLIETSDGNRCQLLITVDRRTDPPLASFVLDSLTSRPAPAIDDVVGRLASLLTP